MAFVDPTQPGQDQTDQNPSQVQVATQPGGQQPAQPDQSTPAAGGGGGGGVASAGSGGGSAPAAAAKPSSSGSWTNLDSYLGANSAQAANMGQQIAKSVDDVGNKAQGSISDLGTNFNSAVQQNTVAQNPDAVNKAIADANSLTAGSTLGGDDQQAFNKQANAAYNGPNDVTNFTGYNQAQQQVSAANQAAKATGSEAGRATLLNKQYQDTSKYGYTQGENNLDQLLLQNSEGAQSALQPLSQKWAGLTGALNNTVNQGGAAVQQAQATDQATASAARDALTQSTQGYESNITKALQAANADRAGLIQRAQSGQLTGDDLKALQVQNQNWGVDVSKYLTGPQTVTAANVTSQNQQAEYNALKQLASSYDPSAASSGIYGGAAASDFGNAPSPVDTGGFNAAVQNAQNTVTQTDFAKNIAATRAALLGRTTATTSDANASNLAAQLATAKTPDEANQMVQQYLQYYSDPQHGDQSYFSQFVNPFTSYYNNEYVPDSQSQIVGNISSLPKNPDGSINWGAVGAPQGK